MIIQSFQLFTSKKLKTLWINKKFTQTIKTRCGKSDAIISCKGFDCMKKLLAISSILLTVCTAFASCGNNDNSYSSDGDMVTTDYESTEKKDRDDDKRRDDDSREDDKRDDRYYDDEHYDADDDGIVDTTGSSNSVKDHTDDAIDGVENAGEDVVDGVGDAADEIIEGAGDAAEDIADGLDGEENTDNSSENDNRD